MKRATDAFWCFPCDAQRDGERCLRCGTALVRRTLKPRLNTERVALLGAFLVLGGGSGLLLPWPALSAPGGTALTGAQTLLMMVFLISALVVASYGLVFGMTGSWRALVLRDAPADYPPDFPSRSFSWPRIRREAVLSLGVLVAGFVIYTVLKVMRG